MVNSHFLNEFKSRRIFVWNEMIIIEYDLLSNNRFYIVIDNYILCPKVVIVNSCISMHNEFYHQHVKNVREVN